VSQTLLLELHKQVVYHNQSALDLLDRHAELSRQQLQQCFENGAVWLESKGKPQRLLDPEFKLTPGQKIHLYCNEGTLTACPFTPHLVADYEVFSIWNKPSGMLSQGSKWGDHWTLYRWIKQRYWAQRETYITHRLDRFTSGLIIVAHDATTNKKLHRLFEAGEIHKTYRAIVTGLITEQQPFTIQTPIDQKPAQTQIRVIDVAPDTQRSLLELEPTTGRKHQLRKHLAETGHPVINDRLYGQPPFSGDLMLQASTLEFIHPQDGSPVQVTLDNTELLRIEKPSSV